MRTKRIFLSLAMVVVLVLGLGLAGAQAAPPSATVTIVAKQVAAGVGYTWGSGVLTFQGKTYNFAVTGLNVAAVGITEITATGEVYHLDKVADFQGNYAAAEAGAALIEGAAGLVMRNNRGVVVNLHAAQTGVNFTLK